MSFAMVLPPLRTSQLNQHRNHVACRERGPQPSRWIWRWRSDIRVKVRAVHAHYLVGVDDVQVTEASDIERLYREAGDRLWWALLAYTGDREAASDAAAEAFARALGSVDSIRDPAAWVWRVAF